MAIPGAPAVHTILCGAVRAVTTPTTVLSRIVSRTAGTVVTTAMAALWGVTCYWQPVAGCLPLGSVL